MKKIFYIVIPVVVIAIAANYFKGEENIAPQGSSASASSACMLKAQDYLKADKSGALIIDVRTQREFESGHLEGAINLDIYQKNFREEISKLDKSKSYYVYCKTGIRSRSAVKYMRQNGFSNVCDLEGGLNYLARAGVKIIQ